MRLLVVIVTLLLALPIVELAALVAVGKAVGLGWALLATLTMSLLGSWVLRHEGSRAWRAFRTDLAEGRPPGRAVTEGLLTLIGGILMLLPGLVTDVAGLLLVVPPGRRVAARRVMDAFAARLSPMTAATLFGPRRVRVQQGRPRRDREPPIEGEVVDY